MSYILKRRKKWQNLKGNLYFILYEMEIEDTVFTELTNVCFYIYKIYMLFFSISTYFFLILTIVFTSDLSNPRILDSAESESYF